MQKLQKFQKLEKPQQMQKLQKQENPQKPQNVQYYTVKHGPLSQEKFDEKYAIEGEPAM